MVTSLIIGLVKQQMAEEEPKQRRKIRVMPYTPQMLTDHPICIHPSNMSEEYKGIRGTHDRPKTTIHDPVGFGTLTAKQIHCSIQRY